MQDMHWFGSTIGGKFQGYTLGNIMGAQFYEAALHAHPEIPDEMKEGQFGTLLNWQKKTYISTDISTQRLSSASG